MFTLFLVVCTSQSDPMRITKKYAGSSSIGKQIYQPSEDVDVNSESLKESEAELSALEETFLKKIKSKNGSQEGEDGEAGLGIPRVPSTRSLRHKEKPAEFADYYTGDLDELEDFEDISNSKRKLHRDTSSNSLEHTLRASKGAGKKSDDKLNSPVSDVAEKIAAPEHRRFGIQRPAGPRSSSLVNNSRRVFSAPNLSTLENRRIPVDPINITDSGVDSGMNEAGDPITNRKRSNSMMALVDFEKLVTDDSAAGTSSFLSLHELHNPNVGFYITSDDLFVEFVAQLQTNKRAKSVQEEPSEIHLPAPLAMPTYSLPFYYPTNPFLLRAPYGLPFLMSNAQQPQQSTCPTVDIAELNDHLHRSAILSPYHQQHSSSTSTIVSQLDSVSAQTSPDTDESIATSVIASSGQAVGYRDNYHHLSRPPMFLTSALKPRFNNINGDDEEDEDSGNFF